MSKLSCALKRWQEVTAAERRREGMGTLGAGSKNLLLLGFNQAPNNLELLQTRSLFNQKAD
jgi:hypothetical protein